MADTKKKKIMVLHEEGGVTPTAVPIADSPPTHFVALKPGQEGESRVEQGFQVTNKDASILTKSNPTMSKDVCEFTGALHGIKSAANSNPQPENISPNSTCKGIKVTLDNNNMWNEFFRCKTEMIITKQGCRMFPYCRYHISGLEPTQKYTLIMDIHPVDNNCYMWTEEDWHVIGKAEHHVKNKPFTHSESPSTGQYWMQNPVSFYKLRLTNNALDQEGNVVLNSMQRYLPRLHVVKADKVKGGLKLSGPNVTTFTFPQTEFITVSSYQNPHFTKLKIDYNPFAKGFKEDGPSSWAFKLKSSLHVDSSIDLGTTLKEQIPVKKSLKSLLANHKPRSSKEVDQGLPGKGSQNTTLTGQDIEDKSSDDAKPTPECSWSHSCVPQRKFSELIREAHVKLKRCNLETTATNNTPHQAEKTEPSITAASYKETDVAMADKLGPQTQPELFLLKIIEKAAHKTNSKAMRTGKEPSSPSNLKETQPVTDHVTAVINSPDMSHCLLVNSAQNISDSMAQPEEKVKPYKRHVRMPLPALALFLKQHGTKKRPVKTRHKSPPPLSSNSQLPSSSCLSDGTITGATVSTSQKTCSLEPPSDIFSPISKTFLSDPEPVLPAANLSSAESNSMTEHSLLTTSLLSSLLLSSLPDKDSTDLNSLHHKQATVPTTSHPKEQAPCSPVPLNSPSCIFDTYSASSMSFPSSPDNLKPATTSSLPVSESSQFVFGPMSRTSLAYPDPTLAVLEQSSDPSALPSLPSISPITEGNLGTMKWHTVLPPPETTYNSYMPTPKLESISFSSSPLLPTHCPRFSLSQPEQLSLETAFSSLPSDPATTFEDDDQSLPFPEALSPLALPLPLSPSFSSLGGDPLSPTPSLSDIVHFFSINDDLEIGDDFPNTEVAPLPCPPPSVVTPSVQSPSHPQPTLVNKPRKQTKKTRKGKLGQPPTVGTSSVNLQPNLEEVEEQLFVSFTSKEALEIHLGDTVIPQRITDQPHQPTDNAQCCPMEKIAALEEALLRDLKNMKHRQVIHPVLQEVGLKMYLLDPALVIDLQYLGVRLPVPPPGASLEPIPEALAPSPSVPVFVSRTGKTTDITQIKGWKDKFAHSESSSSSTTSLSKPEAAPSLDAVTKNLSAFCSDMLDEYLENEGKLIDERAASFSQTVVEPVTYELPTKSTSYVRTLDSVLKKQTLSTPTSALISEFVPPSKRPKLPIMGSKKSKKGHNRQKPGSKVKTKSTAPTNDQTNVPTSFLNTSSPKALSHSKHSSIPEPTSIFKPQTLHKPPPLSKATSVLIPPEHTAPIIHLQKDALQKKKKRLKPSERFSESSFEAQNSSLLKLSEAPPVIFADMAPLESDSELGPLAETSSLPAHNPLVTKALLKQKDLEDMLIWEGQHRTCITKERATVALSSLFTLAGFVCENPTAPFQIVKRRAPPCLKEFCRLGCVCASLAKEKRFTHCSKIDCIFGCSCLRQKVVILKNLEGLDSSTSDESPSKKKKRKKRMTMAYSLKEVESVSKPAQRSRTLWKPCHGDQDPEPLCVPERGGPPRPLERDVEKRMTCARVRAYKGRKTDQQARRTEKEETRSKVIKSKKAEISKPKKLPRETAPPPPELPAEPSKRLEIMTGCKWRNTTDRNSVLRVVCEKMAQDRLNSPFWVNNYLIRPLNKSVRGDGERYCIYHKVHISLPAKQNMVKEGHEEETTEGGRETVEDQEMDELEEWQKEVEDEDEVMEGPGKQHNEDEEVVEKQENKNRAGLKYWGLPFLSGISPAGILIVNKKDSSVSNQEPIQLNGKYYSLAKVQLGGMGALHPANRLAAYLTGRVGSTRQQQIKNVSTPLSASITSKKHPLLHSENASTVTYQMEGASTVISMAAISKSITTATVTSHAPNDGVPHRSSVSKPSVGKDFTQFVVSQIGSIFPQQNFPSSGTLAPSAALAKGQKQVIGSAPKVVIGGTGTPGQTTRKGYQAVSVLSISKPPPSHGVGGSSNPSSKVLCTSSGSSITSSAVTVVSPQKIAFSLQNTPTTSVASKSQVLMIPVPGTSTAVPMSCAPSQPLTPLTPDQRMVLQPVPSNTGAQLFRKPSGQLIQLVPLSQLRALNPNLVIHKGGTITIPTSVSPTSSCSTSTLPTSTSQMCSTSPVSSMSGFNSFSISKLPYTTTAHGQQLSNLLGQKRTRVMQIAPKTGIKEPIPLTCPKVSTQGASKVLHPESGSLTLVEATQQQGASLKPLGGLGTQSVLETMNVSVLVANTSLKTSNVFSPPNHGALDLSKGVGRSLTQVLPIASVKRPFQPISKQDVESVSQEEKLAASHSTSISPGWSNSSAVPTSISPEPASGVVDLGIVCLEEDSFFDSPVESLDCKKNKESVRFLSKPSSEQGKEVEMFNLAQDSSESSPDFSDEEVYAEENSGLDAVSTIKNKLTHNAMERRRRKELQKRLHHLRDALKLTCPKTPKRTILKTAQLQIKELRKHWVQLKKQKMSLRKENTEFIRTISQITGDKKSDSNDSLLTSSNTLAPYHSMPTSSKLVAPYHPVKAREKSQRDNIQGRKKQEPLLDQDLIEVVNLLDDSEEETDNSSDEEYVTKDAITKDAITKDANVVNIVSDEDDDVVCVDIETVEEEEPTLMACAKENVNVMMGQLVSLSDKKEDKSVKPHSETPRIWQQQLQNSLKVLRTELNLENPKPTMGFTLQQACKEIRDLTDQCEQLEKLETFLTHQRDAYIQTISAKSAKSEESILRKLQHICCKQKRQEEWVKGAPEVPYKKDPNIKLPPPALQSLANTPVKALSNSTGCESVAPPASIMGGRRPKTVPNILTRKKQLLAPHPPSLHTQPIEDDRQVGGTALVPAGVFSLVGAVLPGQQIITMSPLQPGQSLLPAGHLTGIGPQASPTPGVASFTINIPSGPHQPIQVKGPARSIAPPAPHSGNVLKLVQHAPDHQPLARAQVLTLAQASIQVPIPIPAPSQTLQAHTAGSAASGQIQRVQNVGLGTGPKATDVGLEKVAEKVELSKHAIDSRTIGSSFCVKLSTSPKKGDNSKGVNGEGERVADDENFTSLLNEIVFLNQQVVGEEAILPSRPDGLNSEDEKSVGTSGISLSEAGPVLASQQLSESRVSRVEMAAVVPRDALKEAPEVIPRGDDDRSLSPLYLRLDEELSDTTGVKEVPLNGLTQTLKHRVLTSHTPPKTQDLRGGNVLSFQPDSVSELGSSPSISHGHNQLQNPQCNAKGDALTPPPLLHMKAGVGVAKILEPNHEVVAEKDPGLAWRPMPRLVPLGLKNNPQT